MSGLPKPLVQSKWTHYADLIWARFRGGAKANKDNSQRKIKGTRYRLPPIHVWRDLQMMVHPDHVLLLPPSEHWPSDVVTPATTSRFPVATLPATTTDSPTSGGKNHTV